MKMVLILLFFFTFGWIPGQSWAEDFFEGNINETYEIRCAHCHGLEGRGDGPSSVIMDPKPTNFVTVEQHNNYNKVIETTIINGRGTMPAFKNILTTQEITELSKFISGLRNK